MAEAVGFEPTVPLPVHLISSQGRYDHFDTLPYCCIIISDGKGKIKYIYVGYCDLIFEVQPSIENKL